MKHAITRREYLTMTAAAAGMTAAVAIPEIAPPASLPKRVLGRTGVKVSIIGMGGGSRFVNFYSDEAGEQAVRKALDLGITYFDTANGYGNGRSETLYGRALKGHRNDVFLVTKIYPKTGDEVRRLFEESLKRLQTDHVDLVHIHKLDSDEDLARIEAKGSTLEVMYKLREEKMTRFIGITAHSDPLPLKHAIERHDFDCVQMALNAARQGVIRGEGGYMPDPASRHSFETIALPAAIEKNLGILAMKVFAQGHLIGKEPNKADARQLLDYALSLPVATAVVGMQSPEMIPQNAEWARTFQPMSKEDMKKLSDRMSAVHKVALDRFFAHHDDSC